MIYNDVFLKLFRTGNALNRPVPGLEFDLFARVVQFFVYAVIAMPALGDASDAIRGPSFAFLPNMTAVFLKSDEATDFYIEQCRDNKAREKMMSFKHRQLKDFQVDVCNLKRWGLVKLLFSILFVCLKFPSLY